MEIPLPDCTEGVSLPDYTAACFYFRNWHLLHFFLTTRLQGGDHPDDGSFFLGRKPIIFNNTILHFITLLHSLVPLPNCTGLFTNPHGGNYPEDGSKICSLQSIPFNNVGQSAPLITVGCLYFVDRAFLYNLVDKTNSVQIILSMLIYFLYMFRANVCPSSGETTVPMRHLVLDTLYRWLSGIQEHMLLHARQSCTQVDTHQVSHR